MPALVAEDGARLGSEGPKRAGRLATRAWRGCKVVGGAGGATLEVATRAEAGEEGALHLQHHANHLLHFNHFRSKIFKTLAWTVDSASS